jgi:hypothetical protein
MRYRFARTPQSKWFAVVLAIDIDVAECGTFSLLVRERNAKQVAT